MHSLMLIYMYMHTWNINHAILYCLITAFVKVTALNHLFNSVRVSFGAVLVIMYFLK